MAFVRKHPLRALCVVAALAGAMLAASLGAPADSLAAGAGQISGKVTETGTHKPLEGIEVCASIKVNEAEPEGFEPKCKTTTAGGEYAISELAAGEYIVEFSVPFKSQLNYITQYYNDKPTEASAEAVTISASAERRENVDAEMVEGGKISGKVSDASSGSPIENALACAFSSSVEAGGCAITAADGTYTISGLPTSQYRVVFAAKKYTPQVYNGKAKFAEADLVQVTAPNLTAAINAALAPAVQVAPPSDLTPPAISGAPSVGAELSCADGLWAGNPAPSFTYSWLRDGSPVAGALASTYTVQAADAGHSLTCEVTATNHSGQKSATSAPVAIGHAAKQALALTIISTKVTASKGSVRVRVKCTGGPCHGQVELIAKASAVRSHGKRMLVTASSVYARGSFSLAQNATATLTLDLTKKGRGALAHAARKPRPAALLSTPRGGRQTDTSVLVG
ncbi:MAG TPA: carboxypeptidase regulatory-like domain-containing protein [Solirubrobacteraceae bacterium]